MASYNDSSVPEGSNRCGSGSIEVPKESVQLDVKRAVSLPRLRSKVAWENGLKHSGSRAFAGIEGVICTRSFDWGWDRRTSKGPSVERAFSGLKDIPEPDGCLIRWRRGCSLGRAYRRSTVVTNCTSPSDLLGARNRSSSWSVPSGGAGTKTRWVTRTMP
jgi:hypothetical protein